MFSKKREVYYDTLSVRRTTVYCSGD